MKIKSKKITNLLAVLLCATCILCQSFVYASADDADSPFVNGWIADYSPTTETNWTDQVKLVSLGEDKTEITTAHLRFGSAVNKNSLKSIRTGKFSIDFELKDTNISDWHSIWIPIVWNCYHNYSNMEDTSNPDAARTNNGLTIQLTKGNNTWATGWRAYLINNETRDLFQSANWDTPAADIDLSQKLHIVVETIGGNTNVYFNGKLYGTTQFTADGSGYLWNGAQPTIAIGGGPNWDDDNAPGVVHAIIDTHAPDSTEALQALIDECDAAKNFAPDEAETAFRDAVAKAKTDINGAEPVVLAAIGELTAAKETYDAYFINGDIDVDGKVSGSDLIVLRKQLLGITVADKVHSDINGDNIVDLLDLIHLKKVIAEKVAG